LSSSRAKINGFIGLIVYEMKWGYSGMRQWPIFMLLPLKTPQ
jgi:hypothetical protein